MYSKNIFFQSIDWDQIPKIEHKGEEGGATWQTLEFEGLRIRIVNYSKGYIADHWCKKGHIVHCLEGDFISEMKSGEQHHLYAGMSYIVLHKKNSHKLLHSELWLLFYSELLLISIFT